MSATVPEIISQNNRRFSFRRSIERYKAELGGIPFRVDPDAGPDVLVPIKTFASEMGVTVRTIERRIAEARHAAIAAE
jgi:hypothetical protein